MVHENERPKAGEEYTQRLADPLLRDEIITAFEKNKEKQGIELESEDFVISKVENIDQNYKNKKITEN